MYLSSSLSFMISWERIRLIGPDVFFGMVRCPCFLRLMVLLLGLRNLLRVFFYLIETALGRYSSGLVSEWSLPDGFDADEVSARMLDAPKAWSDGSMVLDSVTVVSSAGAGLFAHQSEHCWSDRRWCHVDRVQSDGVAHSCRGFVSVPGPLQTVQRTELWEVILALQSADAVHMGVDNPGAARHAGRPLDDCSFATLLSLLLMVSFLSFFAG